MKTATVTTKMDPLIKSRVQKIAAENGVTLSLIISQHLRKIARDKTIPFEDFIPNAETIRAIREAERDIKTGRLGPVFDNVEDFIKDLEKNSKK